MRTFLASALIVSPMFVSSPSLPEPEGIVRTSLGELRVTSYRSVKNQTDSSPNFTSIGIRTNQLGVAVSQDLLCKVNKACRRNVRIFCDTSAVHYGDVLWTEGHGFRQVFDVMHERHKRSLDIWVPTKEAEKAFHKKYGIQKRRVILVREGV